jgi:predicted nucleic acid-binding protein
MGPAMRAIIDTNILIDYLQGSDAAKAELARYRSREISIISWMEVLVGAKTSEEEKTGRAFLGTFTVHPVTATVAEEAVAIRKERGIRLPDAIIWATARDQGCLLVSRNPKDFPSDDPGVRIPYSTP